MECLAAAEDQSGCVSCVQTESLGYAAHRCWLRMQTRSGERRREKRWRDDRRGEERRGEEKRGEERRREDRRREERRGEERRGEERRGEVKRGEERRREDRRRSTAEEADQWIACLCLCAQTGVWRGRERREERGEERGEEREEEMRKREGRWKEERRRLKLRRPAFVSRCRQECGAREKALPL